MRVSTLIKSGFFICFITSYISLKSNKHTSSLFSLIGAALILTVTIIKNSTIIELVLFMVEEVMVECSQII